MNEEAHEALEALGVPAESEGEVSPPPPPILEVAAEEQAQVEPESAPYGSPFGSSTESPETESHEPSSGFDSLGLERTPDPFAEVTPIAGLKGVNEEPSVLEPPAPVGFEATAAEEPAFGLAEPETAVGEDEDTMMLGSSADEPAPFGMAEGAPADMSPDLGHAPTIEEDATDDTPIVIGGEQTHEVEVASPEVTEPISLAPEPLADEPDVGVDSSDANLSWSVDEAPATPGPTDEGVDDVEGAEEAGEVAQVSGADGVGEEVAAPLGSEDTESEFVTEPVVMEDEPAVAEPEPSQVVSAEDRSLDLIMPDDVTPESEESTRVVTATMADLHVQQGLYEQAREMYGQLLERDPGNGELAQKLADLAGKANAPVHAEAPAPRAQRFSVVMTGGESARALLLSIAGAPPEPRPPRPRPLVQSPAMPSPGSSGDPASSFDQFFGDPPQQVPDAIAETPDAGAKEPGQGDDQAFQSWLKDLKT